jgi:hypothetical protein
MKYTLGFGSPLPPGWGQLVDRDRNWDRFSAKFGFQPGVNESAWPAIDEPIPSMTFDLTAPVDVEGAWQSRFDAVNAEALRCFVSEFTEDPTFVVLDWQHPGYRFNAAIHAATRDAEWRVPVFPDGDYYIFMREDLSEGTFGHPWERTLCVFGERLVGSLGRTLATWLPVIRLNGQTCD